MRGRLPQCLKEMVTKTIHIGVGCYELVPVASVNALPSNRCRDVTYTSTQYVHNITFQVRAFLPIRELSFTSFKMCLPDVKGTMTSVPTAARKYLVIMLPVPYGQ